MPASQLPSPIAPVSAEDGGNVRCERVSGVETPSDFSQLARLPKKRQRSARAYEQFGASRLGLPVMLLSGSIAFTVLSFASDAAHMTLPSF